MQKIEKKLNITPPPPKKKTTTTKKKQWVINNGFLVGEVCKLYSWLKVMGMIKLGQKSNPPTPPPSPPPQKKKEKKRTRKNLPQGFQQNPNKSLGQKKEI